MEIDAEVRSIEKLDEYYFVVPDYQREYVWKPDDQVEQLIVDIENEYSPDSDDQKSYFIGSMILVKNKKGKYDVIDGQQRLTTIILALIACRDLFKEYQAKCVLDKKAEEYSKYVQELLYKFDMQTDETIFRLELQYEDSKDFLNNAIDSKEYEGPITSSVRRMEDAYSRLYDHFQIYIDQGIDEFIKYLKYILLKIELVVIKTEDLSSALKIFETINERGVGLNAMDLIKNLLFSETKESEFTQIKNIWKQIISNIENCEENPLRFIRYFLIARYYDGVIREDEIYKWIISPEGKRKIGYDKDPTIFAREMLSASKRYSQLVKATEALSDNSYFKHVTHIGFINKYKSRQHLILLLALKDSFSDDDINYFAQQIESYLMFSITLNVQPKYNERRFSGWAKEVRQLETREGLERFAEMKIYKWVCDNYFAIKENLTKKYDWDYNPLYRVRFILGRMDSYLRQESNLPVYDIDFYDNLQIEHILPQTPKNDIIPNEYESMEEYHNWLHSIGNVTIVEATINQALNHKNDLRTDWFADKCEEYHNSSVLLTKLLNPEFTIGRNTGVVRTRERFEYKFKSWDKNSIKIRNRIIFDIAIETWKVNGRKAKPASGSSPGI